MNERKIYEIQFSNRYRPVSAFLHSLDHKTQQKIAMQMEILQRKDVPMQPPAVKAFRQMRYKGLLELRTRINKAMTRIIFYTDDDSIVLLHGFIKKKDRETDHALELARARKLALASGKVSAISLIEGGHQ